MKLTQVSIKNFRLLEDISTNVEDDITLIIGKNNTGKTSFFEAIKLATSKDENFSFEDFSQSIYTEFCMIEQKYRNSIKAGVSEEDKERLESEIRNEIPKIEIKLEIEYDKNDDSIAELSDFITDLDDKRNDACILIAFEPKDSLGLFKSFDNRENKDTNLIPYLKDNIGSFYKIRCYALDIETGYKREIEESFIKKIEQVVSFETIHAMRVLDDSKSDRNNSLAIGFAKYYAHRDKTDDDVKALESTLDGVSEQLKAKYDVVLKKILEDLKRFGADTPITIPDIKINSEFDSDAVIKKNIKYYYSKNEVDLPESYNGLGYSNLIYMILELASFVEKQKNATDGTLSKFLVVMIEEPEAHMHPQMQQVFIGQVAGLIREAKESNIDIQLIVSSHSSHVLSEAGVALEKGFDRIRYFNNIDEKVKSQDFRNLKLKNDEQTFRFLKQYLTLHKADLFFADKAILVEGTTERMLLPQMIKKVAETLCYEYITVMEVGGAYAHKFKEILEFINVKTLVITDIDSANFDDDGKTQGCPVNDGKITTNATLKEWIPKKEKIEELIACTNDDKVCGITRVAFQTEETGYHARSFEDAFVNTNFNLLTSTVTDSDVTPPKKLKAQNQFSFFRSKGIVEKENVPTDSKVKTNFAFDIMSFDEEKFGEWQVPQYIKEGLEWLAKND